MNRFPKLCQGQGQTSRSPKCHSVTVKLCHLVYVVRLMLVTAAVFLAQVICTMTIEICEICQGQGQIEVQWYHGIP